MLLIYIFMRQFMDSIPAGARVLKRSLHHSFIKHNSISTLHFDGGWLKGEGVGIWCPCSQGYQSWRRSLLKLGWFIVRNSAKSYFISKRHPSEMFGISLTQHPDRWWFPCFAHSCQKSSIVHVSKKWKCEDNIFKYTVLKQRDFLCNSLQWNLCCFLVKTGEKES